VREKHAADVLAAGDLAALLAFPPAVTMSGLPGTDDPALLPAWSVLPWDSAYLDARDYQWDEGRHPVLEGRRAHAWRSREGLHRDAPAQLVYNPATMLRLVQQRGATHVRAEPEPSHLF